MAILHYVSGLGYIVRLIWTTFFWIYSDMDVCVRITGSTYYDYLCVTGEAHSCVVLLLLQQCGHILVDMQFGVLTF